MAHTPEEIAEMIHKLTPPELAKTMRLAAWQMDISAHELQTAWQDKNAGQVWTVAANELLKAADKITDYWDTL